MLTEQEIKSMTIEDKKFYSASTLDIQENLLIKMSNALIFLKAFRSIEPETGKNVVRLKKEYKQLAQALKNAI